MAYSDNISRLSRLTSILLKLQSKSFVSVEQLAEVYGVSKRTIYRDLGALEQAGVPLVAIEGKGYSIMEGYNIPPVMFTESEANALIFGEKLIAKTKDESLIQAFNKAVDKIKSGGTDTGKCFTSVLPRPFDFYCHFDSYPPSLSLPSPNKHIHVIWPIIHEK